LADRLMTVKFKSNLLVSSIAYDDVTGYSTWYFAWLIYRSVIPEIAMHTSRLASLCEWARLITWDSASRTPCTIMGVVTFILVCVRR
jgi:hypothetical protein